MGSVRKYDRHPMVGMSDTGGILYLSVGRKPIPFWAIKATMKSRNGPVKIIKPADKDKEGNPK